MRSPRRLPTLILGPFGWTMQKVWSSTTPNEPQASPGVVVEYSPDERSYRHAHERVTRSEIAKRLATLKGFEYAGEYDPSAGYSGPVYFAPSDTLVGVQRANELGIFGEHDLFGGVVPHAFVATKIITHPLVEPDAWAPAGWSHEFGRRVADAVLFGFSVFTLKDAHRAGARLLERGPARIKPVRGTGGRGQTVVSKSTDVDAALNRIDPAELSSGGLVLEENLVNVITYSVGQVRVADLVATYYGTQRLTPDNSGTAVYGGSDLIIVAGNFDALLGLDLSEEVRLAIAKARAYDRAALECFPGLFASRRNYDVARGLDANSQWRFGVLEQSWRIGGATGAEIAALEAFHADPALHVVRASTFEFYGESEPPPPNATVYFRGTDECIGPITKYTLVDPHEHAG